MARLAPTPPRAHCAFLAARFVSGLGQAGRGEGKNGRRRDCAGEARWPAARGARERNDREIEMQRAFFGKRHASQHRQRPASRARLSGALSWLPGEVVGGLLSLDSGGAEPPSIPPTQTPLPARGAKQVQPSAPA